MTAKGVCGCINTAMCIAGFVSCIVAANWAIMHLGTDHGPGSPRTIPVGFGLAAPSGVLFAGAQLTLRDVLHERLGGPATVAVIAATAPLTAIVASPALAVASIVTFVVAELADLVVFGRLRRRGYATAILGSNLISAIVDSLLFLALAFGVTQAAVGGLGMTVGKLEASLLTFAALAAACRLVGPLICGGPALNSVTHFATTQPSEQSP